MKNNRIEYLLVCLIMGSILLGYGTNWMIGIGVFLIQLSTLLMMEK